MIGGILGLTLCFVSLVWLLFWYCGAEVVTGFNYGTRVALALASLGIVGFIGGLKLMGAL